MIEKTWLILGALSTSDIDFLINLKVALDVIPAETIDVINPYNFSSVNMVKKAAEIKATTHGEKDETMLLLYFTDRITLISACSLI